MYQYFGINGMSLISSINSLYQWAYWLQLGTNKFLCTAIFSMMQSIYYHHVTSVLEVYFDQYKYLVFPGPFLCVLFTPFLNGKTISNKYINSIIRNRTLEFLLKKRDFFMFSRTCDIYILLDHIGKIWSKLNSSKLCKHQAHCLWRENFFFFFLNHKFSSLKKFVLFPFVEA